MSTIKYFLPEDGDNEENPNVFLAPKPSRPGYPPLLGQIKDTFPLPGSYHFRFKTALVPGTDRDKHAVAVWMDCVDDSKPVPVWQNSIVAKVTRLGFEEEVFVESAPSRVRTDSNVSAASVHSSTQPLATDNINTQSTHDSLLGSFDDPPAPAPAATTSAPSSSGNLLDVDNHLPSAPASGNSLLDMDVGGYGKSGATASATAHDELLNMSVPVASSQPVPQQQQQPMQQQTPMKNQYGMQYPTPGQQQPQQQQQRMQPTPNGNKPSFNNSLNPLDNLKW